MRWVIGLIGTVLAATGVSAQTAPAIPAPAAGTTASPAVPDPAPLLRAGRIANSLGKFADAETAFRQAFELETGAAHSSDDVIAGTLLDLGLNVSNQARPDEAAALFRRAEPLIQRLADPMPRARLATYRAIDATNRGDMTAALTDARDATSRWRELIAERQRAALNGDGGEAGASAEGEYANALTLQARLELRQDNLLQAYSAASEALLLLNKSTTAPRWWRADALVALGEVSVAQGRVSAAETYFQSALKIRRTLFGDTAPTIKVLASLGRAYQREGLVTNSLATYREVFRLARALPSTAGVFTADLLVPFAAAVVSAADNTPDPAAKRALYAEAFDAFQLVQSPVVDRTIEQAAARLSASSPELAAAIGEVQDHERTAEMARMRLAYQQSLPDSERSGDEETALKNQITAAAAAADTAQKTIVAKFPAYHQFADIKPVTVEALRATLRPGEGVIGFLVGHEAAYAELVTRDTVLVAPVGEGSDALRDAVTALRRPLEAQNGAIGDFNLGEAHRLYGELVGGLAPGLKGIDRLVIAPAGPLANLPFALLVGSAVEGRGYADADWLIRTRTLAYTPSLESLVELRTAKRAGAPPRPLLGFGDPALHGEGKAAPGAPSALARLAGSCLSGGPMPAATLLALAPLPDTARELQTVATALGAPAGSLFLGAEATETNLRRQPLGDYRVLYFATHGLLPGELRCQSEPGLVLTPPPVTASTTAADGLLASSEIAALRLNADLVVLSACNTAAGGGGEGGGAALSGLAQAFFHAGARNMVVSHWQVPSAATTELMTGLFGRLGKAGDATVGDVLRQAQLALIANERTAHPFFWAAFVTMGDGLGGGAPAKVAMAR